MGDKDRFTEYTGPKIRLGIDDLKSEFAFYGNSQGDDSVSNSVDTFISQKGWMSVNCWYKDIDYLNQDEVNKKVLDIKKSNSDRIEQLKLSGDYGKEVEGIHMFIEHDPLYDTIKDRFTESAMTYRYEILDLNSKK